MDQTQGFMKGWNQLQGFYLVQCRTSCGCSKERVQSINSQWKYKLVEVTKVPISQLKVKPIAASDASGKYMEIPFIGGSFIAAEPHALFPFFAACDRIVVSVSWSFATLGNPNNPIETLSLRGQMTCCTLSEFHGHTLLTALSTTNMFSYFQYEAMPDSSSVNSELIK